jgi:predicted AlkP superfamily phosphohydrolase/phosphomutase
VLVFGIDGGTWDVIDDLMEAGELPELESVLERGIHGVLRSRHPIKSPAVWSTIFTGRLREEHGVVDWERSQSRHRRVKTIFEIASEAGLRTHVFNVPATWPPTPVNGTMLSGFPLSRSMSGPKTGQVVSSGDLATSKVSACYSRNAGRIRGQMDAIRLNEWSPYFEVASPDRPGWEARMRIKRLGWDHYYLSPCYRVDDGFVISHPPEMRREVESKLGRQYIPEGPGWNKYAEDETPSYLAEHLTQVARVQADAASLFVDTPWRLFAFVDTLVDRVSHPYWPYSRPEDYDGVDSVKVGRWGDSVREAYRETDRHLGELLEAVDDDTYVLIVSDHGFQSNGNRRNLIGVHHPNGIYLLAGPGLRHGRGERVRIEDVGPTILYLLDLPVAQDMAGRVLPEAIDQLGREIESVASYDGGLVEATEQPVDADTWDQLRSLGYVSGEAPGDKQDDPVN